MSIKKTIREEAPAALCLRCQTNDLFTGSESPGHLSVDYVGIALNSLSSTREKGYGFASAPNAAVIIKISKNKRKIKIEPAQGISKVRYHGNINAGSPKKHKLIFSCMSG